MKKDKPDNIVYNYDSSNYDASLKPFGTNVGAPSIIVTDTSAWHQRNVSKFNTILSNKLENLKKKYEDIIEEFEINQKIYSIKFNFEPIVGHTYYLYKNNSNNCYYLSIISPNEWSKESDGAFRLNYDGLWEQV